MNTFANHILQYFQFNKIKKMNKKVAIPVNESGVLESHFGQARLFIVYQIKDDKIESKETLTPPPHAPGVLPKWLNENSISDVLVFTMGDRAHKILEHFNVNVFLGSPVIDADKLVQGFLNNSIEFSAELCHHHHDHEHEHEHNHDHGHHHKDHNHSTD